MKICYTVCSLNRLGQIIVLAESLLKHNSDYKFFACLADEIDSRIDINNFPQIEFIPFSFLPFTRKNELSKQYDIFELNCALKPFFGNYLLEKYQPSLLIYFDTDIYIYDTLQIIERQLTDHSIIITPHFCSPLPNDGKFPLERDVLNSGLYNGGFIALKNDEQSKVFFQWWQDRLFDQGYNNVCEGMMVDQLWLNLVPIFFQSSMIFKHAGCNVAYWNMYEREIILNGDKFFVNNQALVFFHFSGYRIQEPQRLSLHQNRIQEEDNVVLKKILADYYHALLKSNFEKYLSLKPYYGTNKETKKNGFIKKIIIAILAKFGYALEKRKGMR